MRLKLPLDALCQFSMLAGFLRLLCPSALGGLSPSIKRHPLPILKLSKLSHGILEG